MDHGGVRRAVLPHTVLLLFYNSWSYCTDGMLKMFTCVRHSRINKATFYGSFFDAAVEVLRYLVHKVFERFLEQLLNLYYFIL